MEKYANIIPFTFSCTDSDKTLEELRRQVAVVPGHNVLIAPMNTKISTVGAALLAMEDESIQLCYATAHKYNMTHYSTPGDECYYFSVSL